MMTRGAIRIEAACVLTLVICIGLLVRYSWFEASGCWAQHMGTSLWAIALYFSLRVVAARAGACVLASVALVIALGVELFQLTGVPRDLAAMQPLSRLFLGSDFDPQDLFWLGLGVAIAWLIDVVCLRARLMCMSPSAGRTRTVGLKER